MKIILSYRRPLVVALHLCIILVANYLAFWLRFDGEIPIDRWTLFVGMLPWILVIRGITFIPFRLYEGLWRYTSIWDLRNIIAGVALSSGIFYILVHWVLGYTAYPRSIFVIDSILLISFLGGVRLTRRIYREIGHLDRRKRVLVYGAGDAGEMIVRDMKNNPFYEYEPIGFVDDDPGKVGQRIHGLKVLGTRGELPGILEEHKPDAVLVAITRIEPAALRKIVKALEPYQLIIKTLPNFRDVLDGRVTVSQIRSLSIEDLLERIPVGLDPVPVRRLIRGKRVLVTGAGGSIGSELCRQIIRCSPSMLVLLDRYENGLYEVTCELGTNEKGFPVQAVIADVTDMSRIQSVLKEHRPSIIFHAAAHKHVPLMEVSPCEAVKNNVLGTRVLAEAAYRTNVERFILISTDKAVNPTSVMGVTKRVAELLVQSMNGSKDGHTVFAAVRFGNVLGSNGSAVPRFIQQIKAGGPVTVTHPEMRRFFMLIPEAVQLVLQAAALARGGEIYVLEMGEQIKVVEIVRNLIRLSGFSTEEIPITFIGMRPGEKLYEELVGSDEAVEPAGFKQILRVIPKQKPDLDCLNKQIAELETLAIHGDISRVIDQLCEIVPTYAPDGIPSAPGVTPLAE